MEQKNRTPHSDVVKKKKKIKRNHTPDSHWIPEAQKRAENRNSPTVNFPFEAEYQEWNSTASLVCRNVVFVYKPYLRKGPSIISIDFWNERLSPEFLGASVSKRQRSIPSSSHSGLTAKGTADDAE